MHPFVLVPTVLLCVGVVLGALGFASPKQNARVFSVLLLPLGTLMVAAGLSALRQTENVAMTCLPDEGCAAMQASVDALAAQVRWTAFGGAGLVLALAVAHWLRGGRVSRA